MEHYNPLYQIKHIFYNSSRILLRARREVTAVQASFSHRALSAVLKRDCNPVIALVIHVTRFQMSVNIERGDVTQCTESTQSTYKKAARRSIARNGSCHRAKCTWTLLPTKAWRCNQSSARPTLLMPSAQLLSLSIQSKYMKQLRP